MGSFSVGYHSTAQGIDYSSIEGQSSYWVGFDYSYFVADSLAIGGSAQSSGRTTNFLSGGETRTTQETLNLTVAYVASIQERWHFLPRLRAGLRFDTLSFGGSSAPEEGSQTYFSTGLAVPLVHAPKSGFLIGAGPYVEYWRDLSGDLQYDTGRWGVVLGIATQLGGWYD